MNEQAKKRLQKGLGRLEEGKKPDGSPLRASLIAAEAHAHSQRCVRRLAIEQGIAQEKLAGKRFG